MPQNRKKLINILIGHISTAIVHEILIESTENKEMAPYYKKELETASKISKKYREKINPVESPLPSKDVEYIKDKITNKVKAELQIRISRGYKNIDLSTIEKFVNERLKETNI